MSESQWASISFVVFSVAGLTATTLLSGRKMPDGMHRVFGFAILCIVLGIFLGRVSGYSLVHVVLFNYSGPMARIYVLGVALAAWSIVVEIVCFLRKDG